MHVVYGKGTCLVPIWKKICYKRLCKSKILYTIIKAYNALRYQSIAFLCDRWPGFLFFSALLSCLKQFFFRTHIALSSFTVSFAHLIWHFISNRPVSWIFCLSLLPLSRSQHVQFKSMLRCSSPWSFLCVFFAFDPAASFLLCCPCRFQFSALLITPRLILEVLTPAPTGWRPSVCRSDHWHSLAVAAQPDSQLSHRLK